MASKDKIKTGRALKRRRRVRGKIKGTSDVPRLTVARSLKNIYAQIIDDTKDTTLLGLGTGSKVMSSKFGKDDSRVEQARKVGKAIAELAQEKGIKKVVFDRNQYLYFGRVKALAEGAREKGLEF